MLVRYCHLGQNAQENPLRRRKHLFWLRLSEVQSIVAWPHHCRPVARWNTTGKAESHGGGWEGAKCLPHNSHGTKTHSCQLHLTSQVSITPQKLIIRNPYDSSPFQRPRLSSLLLRDKAIIIKAFGKHYISKF